MFLSIIYNSALLVSYLASDMIDLFKIRTGRFLPIENDINVRDIIMEIFDIFSI